ncbi:MULTISPECIES: iron-siderophore ABC transporter substrate-binding protein [unclassified Brevibacterium]|uniref:iron-siderophore ABC transporter substrate-binding protein n=1 Tax=unclassified Brevibacterium TaxID=2614124 RepID=UPI001E5CA002|nr:MULTISPECIES: iron-siderophore ABC transporter substrate-binding protein [unclassified Brevibacterium]MCD1287232.1 ABC transporter substrate-binding protein [Brevibacterium sp. CCUG 69071]MDK8436514.1 iron-siderophore ABC transporter substrate-binding protein [Brevibacterium sp. H-BE7]
MTRRPARALALTAAVTAALMLTACSPSESSDDASGGDDSWTPVTIEHALGTTEISEKPERVATVNWANHEVPLALGVVPAGMARADFGDDDGNGVLPWVEDKLDELGAETPTLFDETDGIDFEAVADTQPDVILAGYSGLSQEDYDTLSEIAPVVAYPETAWGTPWREMIEINSEAIGMKDEGDELISDLESEIDSSVAEHPAIKDKSTMFLTHVDPSDLSEVNFYTTHDTRAMFFEDMGMKAPASIAKASEETDQFSSTVSAEQADVFDDVDIIVTYGDDKLVKTLEDDELLSQMPAVKNEAIVNLPGDQPLGTAANPTPLSISFILDDYLDELDKAASNQN